MSTNYLKINKSNPIKGLTLVLLKAIPSVLRTLPNLKAIPRVLRRFCLWAPVVTMSFPQKRESRFSPLFAFVCCLSVWCLTSVPASALTAINTSNKNIVPNGLVGYWTFDGKNMTSTTARDLSGNNNTGTLVGTSATSSQGAGKIGQGFLFDGSNDSISVAYNSALDLPDSGGSASVWIKPTGIPVGQDSSQTIFKKRPHSNDTVVGGVALSVYQSGPGSPNYLRAQVGYDPSYNQLAASTTPLINNKWYHVVLTYTSSTIYIYLNGNLEAQMARTRVITWPEALGVLIGTGRTATTPVAFKGTMDEFRMYNRTLTVAEIQTLYKAGGGVAVSAVSTATASTTGINNGLAGYWTLDRKNLTNATATDISGNRKDGTLSGLLNGTTKPSTGKIREALIFNGSTDYIDVGSGKFPYTSASSFSGGAWIKRSGGGTNLVMSNINYVSSGGWYFLTNPTGTISFGMANIGATNLISTDSLASVTDNKWHHVGFSYDGSRTAGGIKLYIDGKQASSTISSNTDPGTIFDSGFLIGAFRVFGAISNVATGAMDDIRLYSRVVTATEMNTLYKQGGSTIAAVTNNNTPKVGINSGLVGYWTFDGKNMTNATATDSSGNGYNGTLTNMTATSSKTIGKIGQGLNFDGTDDYIMTGLSAHYPQTTISAWILPSSLGEGDLGRIIDKRENGGTETTVLALNGNNRLLFIRSFNVTSALWLSEMDSIKLNAWNHVLITYDQTSTVNIPIFYINGIVSTTSVSVSPIGIPVTNSNRYIIGNRGDTTRTFSGKIDDVRMYNRILSPAEVKSLYKLGSQ
jgi:hypothetical protein